MANETIDVLLSEEQIAARVKELGRAITEDFKGREVFAVPVLKGSFMFAADLVRHIDLPTQVDFLGLRSYVGTKSSGVVQIT
ncbi:MAG: hypoxanthine phosphoribosyltransferase, partial [Myxococcales bacterium]|nr:hypoxanthine phosphoribosyltransferase [Myxococcales bacterium]